jgi:hypothetical protein
MTNASRHFRVLFMVRLITIRVEPPALSDGKFTVSQVGDPTTPSEMELLTEFLQDRIAE